MTFLLSKIINPILNVFIAHLHRISLCSFFAFKQNSRSVGAVIDYMGKVSYQDSMREQMAVANPNTTGLKAPGT